jgi:hypothetical protein
MSNLRYLGQKAERHLKEHRPKQYESLKKSGELNDHLKNVQNQAERQYDLVLSQLKENDPSLSDNQAKSIAKELVLHDHILVPSEEDEGIIVNGAYVD